MGATRPIEWPPRSGTVAEYSLEEEEFLRSLIAGCEAGKIDEAALAREVGIFHELKAVMDGVVVGAGDPSLYPPEPIAVPSPDSQFQIPTGAAAVLAARTTQLEIA